jgi:dimethylhistidine N-methyltransferase
MKLQTETSKVEDESPIAAELALDVFEGFSSHPKSLPSRWLYDRVGTDLFAKIMDQPEYYLTRRETEILKRSSLAIANALGSDPLVVIELGAGDGRKTSILLDAFLKARLTFTYVPVDVSLDALRALCRRLRDTIGTAFTEDRCMPFAGDNIEALTALSRGRSEGNVAETFLVLCLGSSIGNFTREECERFIGRVRSSLREGDRALIGFDLIKDPERMTEAYSDRNGVTRDFNLNLLERLNREIGANFDHSTFRHQAIWNPATEGMESWLISEQDQWVEINACGRPFHFRQWEGVRTEVSLKFREQDTSRLAERNGFRVEALYKDASSEFLDALWIATRGLH